MGRHKAARKLTSDGDIVSLHKVPVGSDHASTVVENLDHEGDSNSMKERPPFSPTVSRIQYALNDVHSDI